MKLSRKLFDEARRLIEQIESEQESPELVVGRGHRWRDATCGFRGQTDKWNYLVREAWQTRSLARRLQEAEAIAFTAGLLHDIGKLVFASVEGSLYAGILKQSGAFGAHLAYAEQAAFGVSHASIGARLLDRWGLPENVAVAVMDHHGSPRTAESFERIAATVYLANNLAHHMFDQIPGAPDLLLCSPGAMTLLQLTADDIPIVIAQTQTGLQRVAGLLQMTV